MHVRLDYETKLIAKILGVALALSLAAVYTQSAMAINGLGFDVISLEKLKQHKNNPTLASHPTGAPSPPIHFN